MIFQLSSLFSGLLFGLGMMISGMVDPAKVIGFLDIFGQWNPSLAFVIGGALMVFSPGYFLIVRRRVKPVLGTEFCFSEKTGLDRRLLSGAALFGIGWGLVGFCPGPAVTALGSGSGMIVLFFFSMIAGIYMVTLLTPKPKAYAETAR